MRRQTLLLMLLVLALAFRPSPRSAESALKQQPPQEPGRIVGTVTRAGTADALAEVVVTAVRGATAIQSAPAGVGGGAPGPRASVGRPGVWQWIGLATVAAGRGAAGAQRGIAANQLRAITDAMGQFTIENVPPGAYILRAQLDGYFAPATAGAPQGQAVAQQVNVTVEAGKMVEATFGLIPGGAIGGRVVDARGRPVVDTAVQILRVNYQADGSASLQSTLNRPTDDRGDYRIFRLPPGEYYVVANPRQTVVNASEQQTRTFYPSAISPALSTPIVIRGGEEITGANIQIRNVALAKISGRVINAIPLEAFDPPPAQRGVARGQPALAASNDPALQAIIDEVNKAQNNVQDAQAAMQEARGRLQEARGLRGANQPGQRALPAVQLQLFPRDRIALVDPNTGNRSATAQLALPNDGHFEIANVPPGSYDLYASLPDSTGYAPQQGPGVTANGRSFGRVAIDVGDADVNDVTVTVHQGTDVFGRLIVEGRPTSFTGAHIVLQADDSASKVPIYQQVGRSEAAVAPDGSFRIPAVPEAAYRVEITLGGPGPAQRGARGINLAELLGPEAIQDLQARSQAGEDIQPFLAEARGRALAAQNAATANPVKAYVADVRLNGVSIYDSGFTLGAGAVNSVDVYLETNPGSIAGTVIGADQRPVANATVVLVPPQARRKNPDLYKTATTGTDGKFTMNSLAPGEFKLFAWQSLNGATYLNPNFMAAYESRGSSVSIFAGGQLTAEVVLIKD